MCPHAAHRPATLRDQLESTGTLDPKLVEERDDILKRHPAARFCDFMMLTAEKNIEKQIDKCLRHCQSLSHAPSSTPAEPKQAEG